MMAKRGDVVLSGGLRHAQMQNSFGEWLYAPLVEQSSEAKGTERSQIAMISEMYRRFNELIEGLT